MPESSNGVFATSEPDLIGLARAGDRRAREELFRRHFGIAHRVAYRLLGHQHDAEDAIQDAFLKALTHLEAFDGRSGFRTWLLRIVTNAALDLGRRRRRRPWVSLDEGSSDGGKTETEARHDVDPAAGLHRADLRRLLDGALDQLSPDTRTTFVLFAEAELTYKEVAETQGVPIGTVMSRIHYARQRLQAHMERTNVEV
jgi:RNA polymerase sigma-70 factor (ECF subfamily)